jgi:hypothetical protein
MGGRRRRAASAPRRPPRATEDRRVLGEPSRALLARPRRCNRGDGGRVQRDDSRPPPARREAGAHLARVRRERDVPRAARPCHAGRAPRTERRLRAGNTVRPSVRGGLRRGRVARAATGAGGQRSWLDTVAAWRRGCADGGVGRRVARRAATARRPVGGRAARRLAAHTGCSRRGAVRHRRFRVPAPAPPASGAVRPRVRSRSCCSRRQWS